MTLPLTETTAQTLRSYLRETKATPSEIGKRERFSSLLGTLFGDTREIGVYARGAETSLRIATGTKDKHGRADTVFGSAIVEFERSLKNTLAHAEDQLREYVSGIWQEEPTPRRSLDAVATDGVRWRIYRAVLPESAALIPENIVLELRRDISLSEDTLNDFYRWLNIFLFRSSNLEPTSEAISEDFGSYSHLFLEGLAALRHAWVTARGESEAILAFDTWQSYLSVTYGKLGESERVERDRETGEEVSELDELFLRHTWLVSISRLMVWANLSNGKAPATLRQVAREVFSGQYFEQKRLANLADEDFFHWIRSSTAERILAPIWERVLDTLLTYELTRIREDVLKGVYQQLIDPKDRHDLGEYYTPDWLCERVVAEMLPEEGFKAVLDPSCGSGSFLRASISWYVERNTSATGNDLLRSIVANVKGIDIHPVAVTIARATYVLALGKLINEAQRPIQIPIYLADSLFLPHEVERNLLDELGGIEITFGPRGGKRRFTLPEILIHQPENFDEAIAASSRVAQTHAVSGKETQATLSGYLRQAAPGLEQTLQYEQVIGALWHFAVGLSELIREKQNSIWSFIIRNSYRPAMLRQQFDVILGNPPWVAYRYVTDPGYQKEIKRLAVEKYKIAPKSQKLFTQMELATVFLAHALDTFAKSGAKLAFVMPRSVLSADQHQNLIQRKYSAKFRLTGFWDLWNVQPLFNVPACVLFAEQSPRLGLTTDSIPAQAWTAQLTKRDLPWKSVAGKFRITHAPAKVIWLGSRSALSTVKGASSESRPSVYAKLFKNGATIYPRNFFFVTVEDLKGRADPNRYYYAKTNEESALVSKQPWQEIRLQGLIEGRFLFSVAISQHILPFCFLPPAPAVLPLEEKNGQFYTMSTDVLNAQGYRDCADWMREAQKIWHEKQGVKANRLTLLQRIDYQKGMTSQSSIHRYLVLYNAAGTNVSATYCDRDFLDLRLIVEHKLYWAAFTKPEEAHYLTAILNSHSVNLAIKPFQSTGLLGERDIEKKLLDVPIPRYDPQNHIHRTLSKQGAQAHREAKGAIGDLTYPASGSLARRRSYVRTALSDTLNSIDKLVQPLIGPGSKHK